MPMTQEAKESLRVGDRVRTSKGVYLVAYIEVVDGEAIPVPGPAFDVAREPR